jgi:hypothetical protein
MKPLVLQTDWNSYFCGRCGGTGELVECDGTCLRSFHSTCLTEGERPSPLDPPETPWYASPHDWVASDETDSPPSFCLLRASGLSDETCDAGGPGSRRFCPDCTAGVGWCGICRKEGTVGRDIYKCKMGSCGHYFHYCCLNGLQGLRCFKIHRCALSSGKSCFKFFCFI